MSEPTDIPAGDTPEIVPPAPAEIPAADSEPVEQSTPPADEGKPVVTPEPSPKPAEPEKPQPPTSRRSARYRIEQLARDADLRKQILPKPEPQTDEFGDPIEPQPEPTPDINKLVEEAIAKRLSPVMTEHSNAADDAEINELFQGDRAALKGDLEPKIREAWKLPGTKDLAASDLLKLFTHDKAIADAQVKAVEDYKKAQKEAREGSGSGAGTRRESPVKDAWQMTDEEFKAATDRARSSG